MRVPQISAIPDGESHNLAGYVACVVVAAAVLVVAAVVRRRPSGAEPPPAAAVTPAAVRQSPAAHKPTRSGGSSVSTVVGTYWESIVLALPIVVLLFYLVFVHDDASDASTTPTTSARQFTCTPPSTAARLSMAKLRWPPQQAVLHVSSRSADAQKLFQMGVDEAWNFNQLEARNNFQAAAALDPQCAMCFWGIAHSLGPFVNKVAVESPSRPFPVFSCKDLVAANEAVRTAQRLLSLSPHSELEAALIRHASARFAIAQPPDISPPTGIIDGLPECKVPARTLADREYGESLASIPGADQDANVLAMAAEAAMTSTAWNYYEVHAGAMVLNAVAADALLNIERALALDPGHQLALHLKVHLLEGMSTASADDPAGLGGAVAAADALMSVRPRYAHNQHMPSHAFVRVGRYADAVKANKIAHVIDRADSEQCLAPYLPEHNLDVLVFAAAMAGDLATAERYALEMRRLREYMPPAYISQGSDRTTAQLVWLQFAQFGKVRDDLIAAGTPDSARGQSSYGGLAYARVVAHFSEVLSLACSLQGLPGGDARGASKRDLLARLMANLEELVDETPDDTATQPGAWPGIYSVGYRTLSRVHLLTARARVALLDGATSEAAGLLQQAVALEDTLGYTEPPRLHHPVRQCLAHVLLAAERWQEAADVAAEDLEAWPENGWSLLALGNAHQKLGNSSAASQYSDRSAAAFRGASVVIRQPCPAFACGL